MSKLPVPGEVLLSQRRSIVEGDRAGAVALAQEAIERGWDLTASVEEGYVPGIREVGRLWEEGEYFLPELVQSAEAMRAAMEVMRPAIARDRGAVAPDRTVVLGTVEGDIHDIGKMLVGTLLEANGFRVVDLGHDVEARVFVERAVEEGAAVIGMSALLTTTMPGQARVIRLLEERGLRERFVVVVGGAPVTRRYAQEIGADGFAANGMAAVTEIQKLLEERG